MRLIYTDEAGTSANEPVCVVAAVLVDGDKQLRMLIDEISRIVRDRVPKKILQEHPNGFYIHATDIFSGSKKIKRDDWDFTERVDFLKEIICLPFVYDIPISVGVDFKITDWAAKIDLKSMGLKSNDQYYHWMAFTSCMERADYFLSKYLRDEEVGTVVCENVTEMRTFLGNFGLVNREHPISVDSDGLVQERWEILHGIQKIGHTRQIRNIIDVPHFVEKGKAPMLQLADVCAFAFRHFLSRKPQGADLVLAMLGPHAGQLFVAEDAWFCAGSSGLFNTSVYWTDEQRQDAQRAIDVQTALILNRQI